MFLYEVVRWGNDSPYPNIGGPDGEDTCFLVRAKSPVEAVELAEVYLTAEQANQVSPHANCVYLIGDAPDPPRESGIIRGPYIVYAMTPGWRSWEPDPYGSGWVEVTS